MKKTKKIITAAVIAAIMALFFSACGIFETVSVIKNSLSGFSGGFDPVAYVKGTLDWLYHGEITEEFVEACDDGSTLESLKKDYNDEIDRETEMTVTDLGLEKASRESILKLREAMAIVDKATKYKVGEATPDGDKYDVALTIYPLDIYNQTIYNDDFLEKISREYDTPGISDEEYYTAITERIATDMTTSAQDPKYEEAEEITVSLMLDSNGYYYISDDSWDKICYRLMNQFSL